MPLPRPQRGRPKGSGINDHPRLREIAALLVSNPQIRPTTAIKMLGETDPSVVRRLRDKFYTMQAELMTEVRGGSLGIERPSTTAFGQQLRGEGNTSRVLSLVSSEPVRRSESPAPATAVETLAHRLAALEKVPLDGAVTRERLAELAAYNVMLGLAIQASVATLSPTGHLRDGNPRLLPIAALLRQQIELGEQLMAMSWQRGERKPAPV